MIANNRTLLIQGLSRRVMHYYVTELTAEALGYYRTVHWSRQAKEYLKDDLNQLLKGEINHA